MHQYAKGTVLSQPSLQIGSEMVDASLQFNTALRKLKQVTPACMPDPFPALAQACSAARSLSLEERPCA